MPRYGPVAAQEKCMFIRFISNSDQRNFSPRLRVAVTLAVCLLLVMIAVGNHIRSFNRTVAATQTRKPVETPSVLMTLTRKGFEPSALTIPKGPFFLVFENRSGVDTLD